MGLDMCVKRMPRYKEVTASQVSAIESWFEYETRDSKYADYTFKEWCGCSEADLPDKDVVEHWRKANEIHNWFVENVQDGIDDCDYHHEVTEEMLELLRSTCKAVIKASKLVNGKIECGYTFDDNGNRVYSYEDGLIIKDSSVAERLLPTTSGFFFGSTRYDE